MAYYDCYYDVEENKVKVLATSAPPKGHREPDFFMTQENGDLRLQTKEGEEITLNETKQTKKQAVILFATLLGLREAARE